MTSPWIYIIDFLLENGADPTMRYEGKTALRLCIENDFEDNVKHLIQHDTNDIQLKFENDMTYMHIAIKHGNPIFVRYINGANIFQEYLDENDNSYLHYAALSDNKEIIKLIINYQKKIALTYKDGMTPLMIAVKNNNTKFINEYMKYHENYWIPIKDFYRSLFYSIILNNNTFEYFLPYFATYFE